MAADMGKIGSSGVARAIQSQNPATLRVRKQGSSTGAASRDAEDGIGKIDLGLKRSAALSSASQGPQRSDGAKGSSPTGAALQYLQNQIAAAPKPGKEADTGIRVAEDGIKQIGPKDLEAAEIDATAPSGPPTKRVATRVDQLA